FANLKQNLRDNKISEEETPIVIQFNKRDLPKVRTDEEIRQLASRGKEQVYLASAVKGEGVVETFIGLCALTWDALEKRIGLGSKHGVSKSELMAELARQLGASPPEMQAAEGGIR